MEGVHPKETCERPSRSWDPAPPPRATHSPTGAPAGTYFCIRVSSCWPWDLGQGVYLSEPRLGLVWSQEDEPWAWPLLVARVLRVGGPSFLTLWPVEPCSCLDWMEVLREPSSAGYGVGAERSRKSWAVESFALSPMLPGARETPCLEGGLLVWSVQNTPKVSASSCLGPVACCPGPRGIMVTHGIGGAVSSPQDGGPWAGPFQREGQGQGEMHRDPTCSHRSRVRGGRSRGCGASRTWRR